MTTVNRSRLILEANSEIETHETSLDQALSTKHPSLAPYVLIFRPENRCSRSILVYLAIAISLEFTRGPLVQDSSFGPRGYKASTSKIQRNLRLIIRNNKNTQGHISARKCL